MNKIILIGNLTKDPILSVVGSKKQSVCNFTLAVRNSDGADFFPVSVWNELAKNCKQYLKKGTKAAVVGRLKIKPYEHDGVKMQSIEVVAEEVKFLSAIMREEKPQNENKPEGNIPEKEGETSDANE